MTVFGEVFERGFHRVHFFYFFIQLAHVRQRQLFDLGAGTALVAPQLTLGIRPISSSAGSSWPRPWTLARRRRYSEHEIPLPISLMILMHYRVALAARDQPAVNRISRDAGDDKSNAQAAPKQGRVERRIHRSRNHQHD